jgi:hypothetical protein
VHHPHAALRDLGRPRVLGVVDVVAVQVGGDDGARLGIHVRGHERREVLHRVAVEKHLGLEQRKRDPRLAAVLGHVPDDRRPREVPLGQVHVEPDVDILEPVRVWPRLAIGRAHARDSRARAM